MGWTKLKAFADSKLKVVETRISFFDSAENTVGKGENACYQHFHLFPVFSKVFVFRFVESQGCVVKS